LVPQPLRTSSAFIDCSPMRCLRFALAWLLVALVPLQGFAAAAKLCCYHAAGHHGTVARQLQTRQAKDWTQVSTVQGGELRLASASEHPQQPFASPRLFASYEAVATVSAATSSHARFADARPAAADTSRPAVGNTSPGNPGCGLCGSLCHSVAIAPSAIPLLAPPPARDDPVQLVALVAMRPFDVAEKPPRS
jgi:hypothetical protein